MSKSPDEKVPDKLEEGQVIEWLEDIGIGFEKKKPVQSERGIPSRPAKNSHDAA